MIECKFSLDLTKNGIQKSVYAKVGEINARILIITLAQNGKVYDLTNHSAVIFLENGDNFDAEIVGNTVQAAIPNSFPEPQVRICELRLSCNNSEAVIYSPMFELVIEESYANSAEGESLVNGVQYIIKQEHDSENSHSISMVTGLRSALDSKASVNTVTEHYNEFNQAFSQRDATFDAYVKKTDASIVVLDESTNLLQEEQKKINNSMTSLSNYFKDELMFVNNQFEGLYSEAHIHTNKSTLDKLSEKSGKLLFDGKQIMSGSSGLTDEQVTDLEENTKSRHIHSNADVLDKLSEEDGNLFFDKKPINGGSRLTDSVEFTPDDNIQIYEESYGSFGVLVGVFLEPHANISVGTEIADVEVRMADINNGEYFSIRDMIAFDVTPYLSFVRKVYIDMDYDMPVWLRLLFFTYPFSGIAANLSNYGYTSIRITYYTN